MRGLTTLSGHASLSFLTKRISRIGTCVVVCVS